MPKKPARPELPSGWKRFVRNYADDHAYWYQPKGLAVTVDAVHDRLAPLVAFEGTRPWRECQGDYVKRLNKLRSEEHTSELQSLMRISSAVFCVKKKKRI